MLWFRDIPSAKDSKTNKSPPSMWLYPTPHTSVIAKSNMGIVWDAWWKTVDSSAYRKRMSQENISIHKIAHCLVLDSRNGWSFEFCLRFCEENLQETNSELCTAPSVAMLSVRLRSIVDELMACAVSNAMAVHHGFRYLGSLQWCVDNYPSTFSREWGGDSPDYVWVKWCAPRNMHTADYLILEVKGVATKFTGGKPRNFNQYKAQSINVRLNFYGSVRPVLSYVYFPVSAIPVPVVAQWFNASRLTSSNDDIHRRALEALMMLRLAWYQFDRILRKSEIPAASLGGSDFIPDRQIWQEQIKLTGKVLYVSRDGKHAISISRSAINLFKTIRALPLLNEDSARMDQQNVDTVLKLSARLRRIAKDDLYPSSEYFIYKRGRYKVMVRDATGVSFLRRQL